MTVGAFWRRVIPFSEVIDYDEIQGGRSPELWVYLKNGRKLKFSGLLSDFDELVGMVNSHMQGLPGAQHDSPEKIRDRERRIQGNRAANWMMGLGLSSFRSWCLCCGGCSCCFERSCLAYRPNPVASNAGGTTNNIAADGDIDFTADCRLMNSPSRE